MIKIESVEYDVENMQITVNYSYDMPNGVTEHSSIAFSEGVEKDDVIRAVKKAVIERRISEKISMLRQELKNQDLDKIPFPVKK